MVLTTNPAKASRKHAIRYIGLQSNSRKSSSCSLSPKLSKDLNVVASKRSKMQVFANGTTTNVSHHGRLKPRAHIACKSRLASPSQPPLETANPIRAPLEAEIFDTGKHTR